MTLLDEINKPTRRLEIEVVISGVFLRGVNPTDSDGVPGIIGLKVSKSIDNPVPVAAIQVNRIPNWVKLGQRGLVGIALGYNGLGATIFKGTVQNRAHGDKDGVINCAGQAFPLWRTVRIPAQDLNGKTTKTAIEYIVDYAVEGGLTLIGLDHTTIDPDNLDTPFTLGTAGDASLERQPSAQMIQQIADLERWRIWENNDGHLVFKNIHAPGDVSTRTYSTITASQARIMRQRSREDPLAVRTRLTVLGDTITTGSPPDETTYTIKETAEIANGASTIPGIAPLPDGSYIDAEVSNSLVDTDERATLMALAILNELAFIPRQMSLTIPGDPILDIGQTITIDYPEKNIVAKFYIHGIQHVVNEKGYTTILDLRGGEGSGAQIGIVPFVSFTPRVDREVYSDKLYIFATFDASNSRAASGDLTYAWSDNQSPEITTPDITNETGEIITVRLDPDDITGDWEVTLVVTDSRGLTNTMMIPVDVTPSGVDVAIPAVFAAIDNRQTATPDGGGNWYDRTDVDVVSVTARPPDGVNAGIAVFGQADGTIMKTTDFCQSALTEVKPAAGGRPKIWDMLWDYRDLNYVWAIDEDMRVWRSSSEGDGWSLYDDLKIALTIPGALQIATGSYTGNGSTQSPSVGFEADLIIIRREDEAAPDGAHWRGSHMTGNTSKGFARPHITSGITAIGATTFTVGADREVNESAAIYNWIALANPSTRSYIVTGSYVGNGTSQSITKAGMAGKTPIAVFCGAALASALKTKDMSGTDCTDVGLSNLLGSEVIKSLDIGGFRVGSSLIVNQNGIAYDYIAIMPGGASVGTYTGTGADNFDVVAGLQPDYLIVKKVQSGSSDNAFQRFDTMTGDESQDMVNTATLVADRIQGFNTDGFQVGVAENTSGHKYVWIAFGPNSGGTLRHIGLPQRGGIWVYGGDGAGNPVIAYDAVAGGHNWVSLPLGGELAADLPAISNSFKVVSSVDLGAGLTVVCENADAGDSGVRPIYFNPTSHDPSTWVRATGLSAGFTDARFVAAGAIPRHFYVGQAGSRSVWANTSVSGIDYSERTNVFPVNVEPHRAIWLPSFVHGLLTANVHLIACEDASAQASGVYKSADELLTVDKIRPVAGFAPWPTSAIGRMVAVGSPSVVNEARLLVSALDVGNRKTAWRSSTSVWTTRDTTNFSGSRDLLKVLALTDQLWFMLGFDFDIDLDTGEAIRTKDGGSSWDDVYAAPTDGGDTRLWQDFAMTSDGVLWGLTINLTTGSPFDHTEIWKSTDDGDSWIEVYDNSGNGYVGRHLVAHPIDSRRILVYGHADPTTAQKPLVIFSIDGGVTWNENVGDAGFFASPGYTRTDDIKQLTSNRLVMFNRSGATAEAWYTSDDNGATWIKRTELTGLTAGVHRLHSIVGERNGSRLYSAFDKPMGVSVEDSVIYQSLDSGETWAEMSNFVPILHQAHTVRNGLAYDPIEQALYTWGTGASWTPSTDHVWRLFPVSTSGVWMDVSSALLPWDGDASYSSGDRSSHGIAVIPRS